MEVVPTKLTLIPPSVLALLFGYLEADDVRLLVELTGDFTLRSLCTKIGAVTELRVNSRACAISTVVLGRFPTVFAHLSKLVIEMDVNQDYMMPILPLWAMYLPSTLKEIHFSFDGSIEVFLEPLQTEDDDFTRSVLAIHNSKPMNMAKAFPNLHVLKLQSLLRDGLLRGTEQEPFWNQEHIKAFMHGLPASLIQLELPGWCYRYLLSQTLRKWPQFHNLPALRRLRMNLGVSPFASFLLAWHPHEQAILLKQEMEDSLKALDQPVPASSASNSGILARDLHDAGQADQVASRLAADSLLTRLFSPMMHLQSLILTYVPLDIWLVGLQRLDMLEHLTLELGPAGASPPAGLLHFSLPPNLTSLSFIGIPLGFELSTLLQQVPLLKEFSLAYCFSRPWFSDQGRPTFPGPPPDATEYALTHLPPGLTHLSLRGANYAIRFECALPLSLTCLSAEVPISNFSSLDLSSKNAPYFSITRQKPTIG